jgi:TPR repeat protein
LGVAQDDVQAVKWYGKAAEQGHALAQFNLGGMYGSGRGVKRDEVRSFMWLTLAAEGGDVAAASNRKKVELNMAPEAIAQALELARLWRAQQRRTAAPRGRPR